MAIKDNILISDGHAVAYYVLFPFNYSVFDVQSAERHVNRLYTAISTLYGSTGDLQLSMFRIRNVVSREETIQRIVKTVQMYRKDYKELPEGYRRYIKNIARDFTILAVNLDTKGDVDVENQNAIQMLKSLFNDAVRENFSPSLVQVDESKLAYQNGRIRNSLQRYAVPVPPKLVMNIYVNGMYPSYNLVYGDAMLQNA